MKKIGEVIVFFRVESYLGVAKQVFWGVRTELPGCRVLSGGADQASQSDAPGISFVSKAKRDENQLTTRDMGNPDLSGYLDV